ncbi:uncharacterized protein LOC129775254 isoform X2 [Toxorhynchites rutilus septentrionalis]|uniref:uncharacterized protein LOC129775254 isoform X2 n=1 Tax=Toxorhynchites rutilus septentrionalis TaxID=329112 RepID=UPI00247A9418|nr:uncharacterized protein LOC129775254 isoform X2 [Toxorhynchites rutilus septentrionalis]
MAGRNLISNGCCCCCNQRQLLAVILIFTIAMGAPYSDTSSMSANYLASTAPQGFFATRNNTKVTAQKGGTALLPCTVLTQTAALVSWIRRRDFQLLTVGLSTYSSDDRFLVQHIRHMGHWALSIKTVREEDEGLYECQLSVHPVQSVFIELKVVEAIADIVGAPDLHIDEGSTLRLECKLKQATEYPAYVFWYHEQNMINFDQQNGFSVMPFEPSGITTAAAAADQHHAPYHEVSRHHLHPHLNHQQLHHHLHLHRHHHHHQHQNGGILNEDDGSFGLNTLELMGSAALLDSFPDVPESLDSDPSALTNGNPELQQQHHHHQWMLNHSGILPYSRILSPATSILTIKEVHSKHAGNYTCAPSNTTPASITVHVLQGEKPAAMQHANRSQLEDSKAKGASSAIHSHLWHHPTLVLALPVLLFTLFFSQRLQLPPLRTNRRLVSR